MEIQQSKGESGVVLSMRGDCTVAAARELREALSAVLDGAGGVVLDITGVAAVDITFLQLLLAADAFAREQGGRLTLAGPMPEEVVKAVTLSGMHRQQEFKELLSRSGIALAG